MITWFDALLVTLLAMVTALGARRGLAGLAWGVGALAVALVCNSLGLGVLPATVLALILSVVSGLTISRLIAQPAEQPWHLFLGALGGLLLGSLLISTLALNFPLALRATPSGKQALYPSPDLNPGLYDGIANSAIQSSLKSIWNKKSALSTLLIPDRSR